MLVRLLLAAAYLGPCPTDGMSSKLAAFSILSEDDAENIGLVTRLGVAEKHARNPLLVQDRGWEPRIDNGCKYCWCWRAEGLCVGTGEDGL